MKTEYDKLIKDYGKNTDEMLDLDREYFKKRLKLIEERIKLSEAIDKNRIE